MLPRHERETVPPRHTGHHRPLPGPERAVAGADAVRWPRCSTARRRQPGGNVRRRTVADASREADSRLPPEIAPRRVSAGVSRRLLQQSPRQHGAVGARDAVANAARSWRPASRPSRTWDGSWASERFRCCPSRMPTNSRRVPNRLEADELGLAARLEAVTSRRHRHLLLLGMHAAWPRRWPM